MVLATRAAIARSVSGDFAGAPISAYPRQAAQAKMPNEIQNNRTCDHLRPRSHATSAAQPALSRRLRHSPAHARQGPRHPRRKNGELIHDAPFDQHIINSRLRAGGLLEQLAAGKATAQFSNGSNRCATPARRVGNRAVERIRSGARPTATRRRSPSSRRASSFADTLRRPQDLGLTSR